jgi:hypothetical protein
MRHLLAGTRNMPSQKGKRAKGVQMTEQQPKIPQVTQDIVQTPPTADSVQMPATQDIVQTSPTQDILQMVDIQRSNEPWEEIDTWSLQNGTDPRDLRFWKDGTVPTKEGMSLHLDQWKALCNMSDVIDDLLTRVIEKEPVDWRYHIGDDFFVTIKASFPFVHIRKHFIPAVEWTYHPTKRGVALHFGECKELKQIIPLLAEREPELRQLVPLYRTYL